MVACGATAPSARHCTPASLSCTPTWPGNPPRRGYRSTTTARQSQLFVGGDIDYIAHPLLVGGCGIEILLQMAYLTSDASRSTPSLFKEGIFLVPPRHIPLQPDQLRVLEFLFLSSQPLPPFLLTPAVDLVFCQPQVTRGCRYAIILGPLERLFLEFGAVLLAGFLLAMLLCLHLFTSG